MLKKSVASDLYQSDCYEQNGEKGYLHTAVARIQAYLELGFCYEQERELIDNILSELGTSREEQFPQRFYRTEPIPLTKPRIRRLIKPWSSSKYHTMSIELVPDDIIGKVMRKELGVYEYHSNANPSGGFDRMYILYVDPDNSYIFNMQTGKYYLLVVQEKKERGNEE
ncbi:MAG: hypothetical protein IJA58_08905 [Lachnospiraceae bacterium]|nr:hypothetical protein [Lachnospiraceae bacterium]